MILEDGTWRNGSTSRSARLDPRGRPTRYGRCFGVNFMNCPFCRRRFAGRMPETKPTSMRSSTRSNGGAMLGKIIDSCCSWMKQMHFLPQTR